MRRALFVLLVAAACKSGGTAVPASAAKPWTRLEFNQLAVRLNLPLFWVRDADGDGTPDAGEVAALLFYPTSDHWAKALGAELDGAVAAMRRAREQPIPPGLPEAEATRRRLVIEDLDQGAPTLVHNDLRDLPEGERRFVGHILAATHRIDALHARLLGAAALAYKVPADDTASQSLFRRNWGPRCVAPRTARNPACNAIPGAPELTVDLYPPALQADPSFCAAIERRPDAEKLLAPFVVVRERQGELVPVPYPQAYHDDMDAIAAELRAAGETLGAEEASLKAYLAAAASSFQSNDWGPADEAWSRMTAASSPWFLRIAPDETYWEPCSRKAGFHVTFARINQDSLRWQAKLGPLQQQLEQRLADLIGKGYAARKVTFHLPDFIDIIINAGDDRDPMGATIGQSLPNWGKVADEGRGRTIAMTNLYQDPDSLDMRRQQASSLLDAASMAAYPEGADPGLLGTILHEATHNLGPTHSHEVGGKTDGALFGGSLATMLEELKAQSGALFFVQELVRAGVIDEKLARESWTDAMVWAFGQISRGMVDENGRPLPYPQLAAIQIGFLLDQGALSYDKAARAANGRDAGAFTVHLDRFAAASEAMMLKVGAIKAGGDRAAAEALVKRYVDGDVVPRATIAERFLRFPKQSFVYALEL